MQHAKYKEKYNTELQITTYFIKYFITNLWIIVRRISFGCQHYSLSKLLTKTTSPLSPLLFYSYIIGGILSNYAIQLRKKSTLKLPPPNFAPLAIFIRR